MGKPSRKLNPQFVMDRILGRPAKPARTGSHPPSNTKPKPPLKSRRIGLAKGACRYCKGDVSTSYKHGRLWKCLDCGRVSVPHAVYIPKI